MPIRPKTMVEIVTDAISYIRTNSSITDLNVGSNIRTLIEASALEAREIYKQIVLVLKAFSYRNAAGEDLDRRAADYNIVRLPASRAFGNVILMNDDLNRTYFSDPIDAGSSSIQVEDASVFSTPPVDVKIGEKGSEEEGVITAVDLATNIITLESATTYDHDGLSTIGATLDEWTLGAARISEMDGNAPRVINSGLLVGAPAIGDLAGIEYTTSEATILFNGDFQTEDVPILASLTGKDGNVGPKRVNSFPSSPPFSNALVINIRTTGGGDYAESDQQFIERIEETIGSLSGATVNAILSRAKSVSVPVTGQKVGRVSLREDFVLNPEEPGNGKVRVYIDDGTGDFVPEKTTFPFGSVNSAASATDSVISVSVEEGTLPDSGWILLEGINSEVIEYRAVSYTGLIATLTLNTTLVYDYAIQDQFLYLERVDDNTQTSNSFYTLGNIAIVDGEFSLFVDDGSGSITTLIRYDETLGNFSSAQYLLAMGVGQVELLDFTAVPDGSKVYAWYSHYDGLLEEVQRTLDGDVTSSGLYPGVKAAGVDLLVLPSNNVVFNINVSLILNEGVGGNAERERADRVIRNYVNSLGVGHSFVIHEMVKRVKSANVYDLEIYDPTSNVLVDDNEVLVIGTLIIS